MSKCIVQLSAYQFGLPHLSDVYSNIPQFVIYDLEATQEAPWLNVHKLPSAGGSRSSVGPYFYLQRTDNGTEFRLQPASKIAGYDQAERSLFVKQPIGYRLGTKTLLFDQDLFCVYILELDERLLDFDEPIVGRRVNIPLEWFFNCDRHMIENHFYDKKKYTPQRCNNNVLPKGMAAVPAEKKGQTTTKASGHATRAANVVVTGTKAPNFFKKYKTIIIVSSVIGGIILVIIVVWLVYICCFKKKNKKTGKANDRFSREFFNLDSYGRSNGSASRTMDQTTPTLRQTSPTSSTRKGTAKRSAKKKTSTPPPRPATSQYSSDSHGSEKTPSDTPVSVTQPAVKPSAQFQAPAFKVNTDKAKKNLPATMSSIMSE